MATPSYKLRTLASPLWETATSSERWPGATRRVDGSSTGGWRHPNRHPNSKYLRLAGAGGAKARGPTGRFNPHKYDRLAAMDLLSNEWGRGYISLER